MLSEIASQRTSIQRDGGIVARNAIANTTASDNAKRARGPFATLVDQAPNRCKHAEGNRRSQRFVPNGESEPGQSTRDEPTIDPIRRGPHDECRRRDPGDHCVMVIDGVRRRTGNTQKVPTREAPSLCTQRRTRNRLDATIRDPEKCREQGERPDDMGKSLGVLDGHHPS